jgi:hypothetical protein
MSQDYLERNSADATLNYTMRQNGQKRSWAKNPWNTDNWAFDERRDCYECPVGKTLSYSHDERQKTPTGFMHDVRVHTCDSCDGSGYRSCYTKSKYGRSIQRNERILRLKRKVNTQLASEKGKKLMRRRAHEVETVFRQLKANQGFRRFRLRGTEKVAVERGLLAIGFSFKRLMAG